MARDYEKTRQDIRAERLLATGLTHAIALRELDPVEVRAELLKLPHADLVDMVILLAAVAPIESKAPMLRWWDKQGFKLADLLVACQWCGQGYVRPQSEPGRLYCSGECREQSLAERRNEASRAANRTVAA